MGMITSHRDNYSIIKKSWMFVLGYFSRLSSSDSENLQILWMSPTWIGVVPHNLDTSHIEAMVELLATIPKLEHHTSL